MTDLGGLNEKCNLTYGGGGVVYVTLTLRDERVLQQTRLFT
jgi:hypothetical protein